LPIWTVDTWKVKPGRESHFLQHCRTLNPGALTLFRDLEKPVFFWSPAMWECEDRLNEWRTSDRYHAALSVVKADVLEHVTHLMENIPEFPPRR
jgi:heme-degrading monooxygenase HmoA